MKALLLPLALILVTVTASAQPATVDEVLHAHLDATGGMEAWESVNTIVASGSRALDMPMGAMTGTFEMYQQFPGLSRTLMVTESPMGSMSQEVLETPGGAWTLVRGAWHDREDTDPLSLMSPKTELALLSLENAEFGPLGTDDADLWAVSFTYEGESYERHYRRSDLMLVASMRGDLWTRYDDFRTMEGLVFPHSVVADGRARVNRNGVVEEVSITVASTMESIAVNQEIDPERFTRGGADAR